jgi:hypothetical protein
MQSVQWEPRRYMQTDEQKERQEDMTNFIGAFATMRTASHQDCKMNPFDYRRNEDIM